MKAVITFALVLALLLGWQLNANAAAAQVRSGRAAVVIGSAGFRPGPGFHQRTVPIFVYPYYPYGYYPYQGYNYYSYGAPAVVVSPYAGSSYYAPQTIVATTPYFCAFHQVGWMTRAGLLDHLAGTHKLLLNAAESFCPPGSDACVFPAY